LPFSSYEASLEDSVFIEDLLIRALYVDDEGVRSNNLVCLCF